MNCQHYNKHLYSYCDGELEPQFMLEMERHLAECPSCRFQYELTLSENQVLRDTSDIPELSPDFNQQVLHAIMPEMTPALPGNVLVMSKDRHYSFRRSTMFILSTVAVMLFALCIYLPDMLSSGQQQQQIAQTNQSSNAHLGEPQLEKKSTDTGSDAAQENQKQMDNAVISNYGKLSDTTIEPLDQNPQLAGTSRMMNCEAGRADRTTEQSKTLSISSLTVKNIPVKYILVSQDNSTENTAYYSYQTSDGTETIDIQLSSSAENTFLLDQSAPKESAPLMTMAAPADQTETVNMIRQVEIDGQTITISLSGNISNDELKALADQVVLSKTP